MDVQNASGVVLSEKYGFAHTGDGVWPPSSPQLQQTQQPLKNVLAMVEGQGETSYSKNSRLQVAMSRGPMLFLDEGLERMTLPSEGTAVVVADLGSSSGPNAISNMARIVDKFRPRLPKDAEFQAYFNDLPSNDFNNLFHLLKDDGRMKNVFVAGVPGSFYDRLFARSSVHMFFSSVCLHWMSKIPDAVLDKDSPAYNKGNLWVIDSTPAVAAAYREQSMLDLKNFLQARAAELAPGGLLFFSCCATSKSSPNKVADCLFGSGLAGINVIWSELVAEGILTEHQRDTFNFPVYMRDVEDLKEAVASCGSLFDVVRVEQPRFEYNALDVYAPSDYTDLCKKITSTMKALVTILLEELVGKRVLEIIWERYEKIAAQLLNVTIENPMMMDTVSLVSLIRK